MATIKTPLRLSDISLPPNPPANLAVVTVRQTRLDLSWSASSSPSWLQITNYEIWRDGLLLGTLGNVLTYSDTGLTAGTTYGYQVLAIDIRGNKSALSTVVNGTTDLSALVYAVPFNLVDSISFHIYGTFEYSLDGGSTFTQASGEPFRVTGVPTGNVVCRAVGAGVTQILFGASNLGVGGYRYFDEIYIAEETGSITSCSDMFGAVVNTDPSPSIIDVTRLNTSNVTDFNSMFRHLTTPVIDVSGFVISSTALATALFGMFDKCQGVLELDVSNWNVGTNITNLNNTFNGCRSISYLDLSSWDISLVSQFSRTFANCDNLTCITNIDSTAQVTTDFMFENTPALTNPNASEQTQIEAGFNYVNANPCP